ncbi:MAG TPA: PP2C family serine/threonine-protein phosphatase [Trebonia sp.]|nr:PP2C family serine/threonine-protein phosphatase [Trebonia sp.]
MTRFWHAASTSPGQVRRVNEDSYIAQSPLFAVADGMGGHGSGDLASRLAIDTLTVAGRLRPLSVEGMLGALDGANRAIVTYEGNRGMGTTVTGLALVETTDGDRLMVFNVGDSRVYRLAGGQLQQVTVDHSEVQELVEAGVITRDQARIHPRRNIVTRALGTSPPSRPDYWLLAVAPGDRYLICSDGLYSEVPDEHIASLLTNGGSPQATADGLVAAAEVAGGHDNITVIIVDVVGFGDLGEGPYEDQSAVETTPLSREELPQQERARQEWPTEDLPRQEWPASGPPKEGFPPWKLPS